MTPDLKYLEPGVSPELLQAPDEKQLLGPWIDKHRLLTRGRVEKLLT